MYYVVRMDMVVVATVEAISTRQPLPLLRYPAINAPPAPPTPIPTSAQTQQ